ncbi:MAG: DUF4381 domain-containing protein [Pseudomonadota bacterium]
MSEDLQGLDLVELIDRLEPAPEPPPISLMPETAAWAWLALAVAAGAFLLWRRWQARRAARRYRGDALLALAAAGDDPAAIATVLRRTALTAFARADVASLHGDAWLAFLDRAYGGTEFTAGAGRALATAPYRASAPVPGLADLARRWVRAHKAGAP